VGENGTLARLSPDDLERMLDVFAKENQVRACVRECVSE
jgi:hypothetical protein